MTNRAQLITSINKKWKAQGLFIRFRNGNTGDCSINNLCQVQIEDAMKHIDDWTVDWDLDLTQDEIAFVKEDSEWRADFIALRRKIK